MDIQAFAHDWINAWNSHDIEAILSHYADEIIFTSPFVAKLNNAPDGTLRGREALRDYFLRGLRAYPELHFELLHVAVGVGSVTLIYRSVNNLLAAEVMEWNSAGQIQRVLAHYSPLSAQQ